MDFIFFPESMLKKLLKSKFSKILEPLFDFIFNFEVYNFGLKTSKKLLSREFVWRESFFESF
jgi:hypothetical protein